MGNDEHTALSIAERKTPKPAGAMQSANLDLLRSFAVLAVLVTHWTEAFDIQALYYVGQTGVILFFVHTCTVLLQSLQRLHADGLGHVSQRFLIQRVFRIFPLYWAAILVSLSVPVPWRGALTPHPSMPWLGWKWIVTNLLLLQNLTADLPVSTPMWSLPYEMQMYLALPAIYWITQRSEPILKISLVSLAAIFFTFAIILCFRGEIHQPPTYFVPCFLGGAYAFVLSRKRPANLPSIGLPFLLLACALLFSIQRHLALEWVMGAVVGFALPQFREIRNTALRNLCHMIATYSYGIYLWHWPLLWFWFRRVHGLPVVLQCALFCCSLALLSMGSYHLLELPLIGVGRRVARRSAAKRLSTWAERPVYTS